MIVNFGSESKIKRFGIINQFFFYLKISILKGVFQQLLDVANMQGGTAMTRKTDKVQSLLVACKFSEARFLIRSLTGKLRVGLAELSLLQVRFIFNSLPSYIDVDLLLSVVSHYPLACWYIEYLSS
jgi:ATP-dependent DNA ligase